MPSVSKLASEESFRPPQAKKLTHPPQLPNRVPGTAVIALATPSTEEKLQIRKLAASVAKASLEVLAGTRAPKQLARLLSPEVFGTLQRRAELTQQARSAQAMTPGLAPRAGQSPQIRSAHGCSVAPGIYELSVLAADGPRYRAIALRIEQQFGNWIVTVLQIG